MNPQIVVQIQGTRGMKGACKELEEGLEEEIVNSVYLNQNYQSLSEYILSLVGSVVINANLIEGHGLIPQLRLERVGII
jgi:hypothetical protein